MEKLYKTVHYGGYVTIKKRDVYFPPSEEVKTAEVLEGIVTKSYSSVNYQRYEFRCLDPYMESNTVKIVIPISQCIFSIDNFPENLLIEEAAFRLDIGERVRVHSFSGFDMQGKSLTIDGLQILDDKGNSKFNYKAKPEYYFK